AVVAVENHNPKPPALPGALGCGYCARYGCTHLVQITDLGAGPRCCRGRSGCWRCLGCPHRHPAIGRAVPNAPAAPTAAAVPTAAVEVHSAAVAARCAAAVGRNVAVGPGAPAVPNEPAVPI